MLFIVTWASVTALPCWSVTVPRTEPVSVCANTAGTRLRASTKHIPLEYARSRFIESSQLKDALETTGLETTWLLKRFGLWLGSISFAPGKLRVDADPLVQL